MKPPVQSSPLSCSLPVALVLNIVCSHNFHTSTGTSQSSQLVLSPCISHFEAGVLCVCFVFKQKCFTQPIGISRINHSVFQLQDAISVFSRQGHHILVFGRRHMMKWEVFRDHNPDITSWFFTSNVLVTRVNLCFLYNFIVR